MFVLLLLLLLVWAPLLNIESDLRLTVPLLTRSGPLIARTPIYSPYSTAPSAATTPKMQSSRPTKQLALLEPHLTPALLKEVREFWFEHLTEQDDFVVPKMEHSKRWFMGGKEMDDLCVKRFAPALEAIRASGATTAHDILTVASPRSALDWLSLILLLDQMPRNVYRGSQASLVFTVFDPMALQIAMTALQQGVPESTPAVRWRFAYRSWFALPLMHSEDAVFHERAVEEYQRIEADVEALAEGKGDASAAEVVRRDVEAARKYVRASTDFERKHQEIIERFGRYPHRNKVLGREPTREEEMYLENGGETFSG